MTKATCSVVENGETCGAPAEARGWCHRHYTRWWRGSGDPSRKRKPGATPRPPSLCDVEDCDDPVYKRIWCNAHYIKWRRYGDPLGGGRRFPIEDGHRRCSKCLRVLSIDAFPWRSDHARPHSQCRECMRPLRLKMSKINVPLRRARKKGAPRSEPVDRLVVFARDRGACGICGEPVNPSDFHVDHVIPLCRGGEHTYANVQLSHPLCNMRKGRSTP